MASKKQRIQRRKRKLQEFEDMYPDIVSPHDGTYPMDVSKAFYEMMEKLVKEADQIEEIRTVKMRRGGQKFMVKYKK